MGAGTSNSDRSSEAIVADTEQDAAELLTKIGRYYQAMYNLGDIRSPGPELRAACAKLLTVADWLDTARDEQLQEQAAPPPDSTPRQPASLPQAVADLLAENPGQTWTPSGVAAALQERGLAVGAGYRHHVKVALGRMAQRNDSNIHKLDRGKYLYSPAGETTMR
ncbi:hypothetical protein [Nocardia huaxiensis]|uniref:Uncharacterized protein n=1 Tax=Nocardia huaxiensis TaxID=2755382 RepID=A0A7D6ZKQ8_9NOCA|nr:hypothetical protein [Nocardia huaxiensis]QLY31980.1 hypothetical protein H0264_06695 [Nocardia huaxiensis]UFS95552.1 hypothetical protein LPY97_33580 [Nocardia huaxiensis]